MDKEKLLSFIRELKSLENKYGIYVSACYEQEIEYDWDENSSLGNVEAYLLFTDSNNKDAICTEELISEALGNELKDKESY